MFKFAFIPALLLSLAAVSPALAQQPAPVAPVTVTAPTVPAAPVAPVAPAAPTPPGATVAPTVPAAVPAQAPAPAYLPSPAPVQLEPITLRSRPSTFQFSIGAGIGFQYVGADYIDNDDSDAPDAIAFNGTLSLGAMVLHRPSATSFDISLIAGYRGSLQHSITSTVDTGTIHNHEVDVSLAIGRRVVIGLGGGFSMLHTTNVYGDSFSTTGGVGHFDIRIGLGGGTFFGVSAQVAYYEESEAVIATTGLQFGWMSLR